MNRQRFKAASKDAKRHFLADKTHLIEPEIRRTRIALPDYLDPGDVMEIDRRQAEEGVAHFPPVRVIGKFGSAPIDPYEDFSYLVLVWRQDAFDRVPDEGALARLKALDWPSLAEDYSH